MFTENVQSAIRRNIELAFVKKAKVEFKGDRSEARILVSKFTTNVMCVFREHSESVQRCLRPGEK